MNWYLLQKFAQIWNIPEGETFGQELIRLHKLEYMYNTIKIRGWNGHPKRKENILQQLEIQLKNSINKIKPPLLSLFQGWLQNHAINNPDDWSNNRVEQNKDDDFNEGERLRNVLQEFMEYHTRNQLLRGEGGNKYGKWYNYDSSPPWNRALSLMFQEIYKNPNNFKSLDRISDYLCEDRRELMYSEANNLEGFNTNFIDEMQAKDYVSHMTKEQMGISVHDILEFYDEETLVSVLEAEGLMNNFLFEVNKNIVFPLWMEWWKNQKSPTGTNIIETRKNVEQIYKMLRESKTVNDEAVAISLSLNVVHQNGNMIKDHLEQYGDLDYDYIEDVDQRLLDSIHNMRTKDLDKKLREIGVQI